MRAAILLWSLASCDLGEIEGAHVDASRPDAAVRDAGSTARPDAASDAATDSGALDAGPDAGTQDAGFDAGPPDPCAGRLLCESFEDYEPGPLSHGSRIGIWQATVGGGASAMAIDETRATTGRRALRVHVETGEREGGRLFARGDVPVFADRPTHLYGRMRMYLDPDGSSVHWTYFGASGDAVSSSPVSDRRATYLMSSLRSGSDNRHSFVYGLTSGTSGEPYRDCYRQGPETIARGRWSCVAFEMDSEARVLRAWVDAAETPTVQLTDTGAGCVGAVPGDTPWYGPRVAELYVGAWSFHPMDEDLDVWIDDVIVDTEPVPCGE